MKSAKLVAEMCLQRLMNMEVNIHCDQWDKFRAQVAQFACIARV